jgi:DNA-binding transcriptional LysR family regulator
MAAGGIPEMVVTSARSRGRGIPEGMAPNGIPEMDADQIQEMPDMVQENGIDTTEAEEALENGDMDAVFAFMEENRPQVVAPEHGRMACLPSNRC